MGMDLIGVGFTHNRNVKCSSDAIENAINSIPDATLLDEGFLNRIDPSGYLGDGGGSGDPEHVDYPDYIRDFLKEGAQEYDSAVSGHRLTTYYEIGGTPLSFTWTGGGSWGDDPFDGFTPLCYFIALLELDPGIAQLAGFVAGGLPNATIVNEYAEAVA